MAWVWFPVVSFQNARCSGSGRTGPDARTGHVKESGEPTSFSYKASKASKASIGLLQSGSQLYGATKVFVDKQKVGRRSSDYMCEWPPPPSCCTSEKLDDSAEFNPVAPMSEHPTRTPEGGTSSGGMMAKDRGCWTQVSSSP